jgi:beta-mannosidase
VRFASECLGFSNVPEDATVALATGGSGVPQGPSWKARVPRDAGAGWDFEDVRDHYLSELFGHDPAELRATDPERYLTVSRVVTGELMAATFAEWRRAGSRCAGGLVWFYKDLWPGAGWGLIDSEGVPKAPYWYLRRTLQPVAFVITDEGLNGLCLHAVNDTAEPLEAELSVAVDSFAGGRRREAGGSIVVPPRDVTPLNLNAVFGSFLDLNYAYRFGPPQHDIVSVLARDSGTGSVLARLVYLPRPRDLPLDEDAGLRATVVDVRDGAAVLEITAERLAYAVRVASPAHVVPGDNYFSLAPGAQRTLPVEAPGGRLPAHLTLQALNSRAACVVQLAGARPGR